MDARQFIGGRRSQAMRNIDKEGYDFVEVDNGCLVYIKYLKE
ncbi:unnamed protein product [marine sediment metagenome]|uniref:Uncharacterized protein n=1 Tax=marine sediment metagenome TaxID=412755 RepID=X1IWC7_9ZZZZ